MKNPIHWLTKMSDVWAQRQFLRVLNPMMNVVRYAMEVRTTASFTPFGLPPIVVVVVGAKHIQNVLPNLQMELIQSVCGKKVS